MVCCNLGTNLGEVLGTAGATRCMQQDQHNALHSAMQSLPALPCSKAQRASHHSAVPKCTLTPEPQLKANVPLLLYPRKGLSLQKLHQLSSIIVSDPIPTQIRWNEDGKERHNEKERVNNKKENLPLRVTDRKHQDSLTPFEYWFLF